MMFLEKPIDYLGKAVSILIPVMTGIMILIIVCRYFFGIGLTGLQELVMYMHAFIFLGCAGYVHYKNEHVRVDVFYRSASSKYKSIVNKTASVLFLIPVCFIIGYYSLEQIELSWRIKETSTEAGGLQYTYIQKTFLLLFPITLLSTLIYQTVKNKWN